MKCDQTVSLGVYVLGAASSDESALIERHLSDCTACRDEFNELSDLEPMLSRLTVDDFAEIVDSPVPSVGAQVGPTATPDASDGVPGRSRAGVRVLIAGAAVVLAAVAIAGGVQQLLSRGDPVAPSPIATTLSAVDPATGVAATAVLTAQNPGTRVALRLTGLPPGERCHLEIRASDGRVDTSGTWTASYSDAVAVPVSTSVAPADIDSLQVVTTGHRVLVQLRAIGTGTAVNEKSAQVG